MRNRIRSRRALSNALHALLLLVFCLIVRFRRCYLLSEAMQSADANEHSFVSLKHGKIYILPCKPLGGVMPNEVTGGIRKNLFWKNGKLQNFFRWNGKSFDQMQMENNRKRDICGKGIFRKFVPFDQWVIFANTSHLQCATQNIIKGVCYTCKFTGNAPFSEGRK